MRSNKGTVVRWLLQLGGRWLASQVWRGVRGGGNPKSPATPSTSERGKGGVSPSPGALDKGCVIAIVCGSRRLFDGFAEALSRKRTIDASRFRVASGLLGGVPVVAALPHDTTGGLTNTLAALVDGHHPGFIISVGEGTSGGDSVEEGEIVVATQLVGPKGERLELDGASPHAEWVHRGRVDALFGLADDPLAVDSWSWANATACSSVGVPLVAITAVTKPFPGKETPSAELFRQSATLARRTGTFAGLAWRQPKELKRAWQLQTAAWQACDRVVKLVAYMATASTR